MLFVSPVVPADTGNGLAMRAALMVRAFAPLYDVTLAVAPLYWSPVATVPGSIAALCREVHVGRIPVRRRGMFGRGGDYDAVHVFRLAALPFAYGMPGVSAASWRIDLDDVESVSRRRVAAIARERGASDLAAFEEEAADRAAEAERQVLDQMDRVYVCSEVDRARLHGTGTAEVCVAPNGVPVPALPSITPPRPPRMLFVGTLGYLPNQDGVEWCAVRVLPLVQAEVDVRLEVVGFGDLEPLRPLGALAGVRLVGQVEELEPLYRAATLAVNPVRAGGGTRIKVLEAFALGCPVVSTSIGLEGIDAVDEQHLLVADTPEAFARSCVRLVRERAVWERLRAAAHDLVSRRYSAGAVMQAVREIEERPRDRRS